ncbi:MAG: PAS domain-containing protein [Pseudomonadota bacterium]
MSNVTRQHWKSLRAAFSPAVPDTLDASQAACACMEESRLKDIDRFSDCVSIHTLDGKALYVSAKALYTFCTPVTELMGDGFQQMLVGSGFDDFVEYLQACHHGAEDLEHEFRLSTRRLNTDLTLRFMLLERCQKHDCQQTVMVLSRQTQSGPNAVTQAITPKPELTDVLELIQSCLEAHANDREHHVTFNVRCERDVLPRVTVDPALLQELFQMLLGASCSPEARGLTREVQIGRSARHISIRLFNPLAASDDRYAQWQRSDRDGTHPRMSSLSRALGVKVKVGNEDTPELLGELQVPINAGVALPDPESFAAELVSIHKPANTNANPIPKMQSTG